MCLISMFVYVCEDRMREPSIVVDPVHTGLLLVLVSVCGG